MTELLELMAAPFVACVILVGIHAYLGLHVIQRKVIFVDLALAQIAALGATFSFLMGMSPHGRAGYFFSLAFAVAGAAIFSMTRMRHERIPQEAIIGIVYAVAMATAILVADRAPEGAEHIKESLVGSILWVTWPTVLKTSAIYALVGGLHVLLRKRIFQISFEPERAFAEGRRVRVWDFIFYVTFALVITSSVAIAGVLLVFSFLVIPAVVATMFATRIGVRLAIGWTVGIAACLLGLVSSYRFDLPSGPTVVAALGLALAGAGMLNYILTAERRRSAVLKASVGLAGVIVFVAVMLVVLSGGDLLHIPHEHDWEPPPEVPATESADPLDELAENCGGDLDCLALMLDDRSDFSTLLQSRFESDDPTDRVHAVEILARMKPPAARHMIGTFGVLDDDPLVRLSSARALIAIGDDSHGLEIAVGLLGPATPLLYREEAFELLVSKSGEGFGYDPLGSVEDNARAIDAWRTWLESR